MVKQMIALLSIASLGVSVAGCGGVSSGSGSTSTSPDGEPIIRVDPKLGPIDDDDPAVLEFGHAPSPVDLNRIITLVRRYYAAAVAEDGPKACSMLYVAAARSVVDEEGRLPNLRGKTCPVVVSKLFKLHHQQLVMDLSSIKIVDVRTDGLNAHVLLRFAGDPYSRNLDVRRDGIWKVRQALDNPMP